MRVILQSEQCRVDTTLVHEEIRKSLPDQVLVSNMPPASIASDTKPISDVSVRKHLPVAEEEEEEEEEEGPKHFTKACADWKPRYVKMPRVPSKEDGHESLTAIPDCLRTACLNFRQKSGYLKVYPVW